MTDTRGSGPVHRRAERARVEERGEEVLPGWLHYSPIDSRG